MKILLRALIITLALATAGSALCAAEVLAAPTPLERAKELLLSNKPAEAIAALSSCQPAHEEMSAYHYAYARALVALKKSYDSLEHYRLAYVYADSIADRERLLMERADAYAAMGYFSEAAVCYDVFLALFPRSSFTERAELGIAEARFRNGEFHQALPHYEKSGTSVRAVLGKANTLQSLGRTAEAGTLYQALIEHDPKTVSASQETLYFIGENYRQAGKLRDARLYYESVKDPVIKFRALLGLGRIALEEKNPAAAVLCFTSAVPSPERTVRREAILSRAEAQLMLGKDAEARAGLEDIRNNYPYGKAYDQAVLLTAKLDRKQGKHSEALASLKTLIYRRSPSAAALDEIESIVLDMKDKDPAQFLRLWGEAGRWLLDPSRAATIVKVAAALRYSGKPFLDACAWLIKYGPEDTKAEGRLLLADFYADLGDVPTAWTYIGRTKIKGHDDDLLRVKARIYLANRDAQSASEAILSLREPVEADALRLLEAMPSLRNSDRAEAFCERILGDRTASAGTLVRFADVLYGQGKKQKALEYYRAAVAVKHGPPGDTGGAADREWARYRTASIAGGAEGRESLAAIQSSRTAVGRFAAAELKSAGLQRKVDQNDHEDRSAE